MLSTNQVKAWNELKSWNTQHSFCWSESRVLSPRNLTFDSCQWPSDRSGTWCRSSSTSSELCRCFSSNFEWRQLCCFQFQRLHRHHHHHHPRCRRCCCLWCCCSRCCSCCWEWLPFPVDPVVWLKVSFDCREVPGNRTWRQSTARCTTNKCHNLLFLPSCTFFQFKRWQICWQIAKIVDRCLKTWKGNFWKRWMHLYIRFPMSTLEMDGKKNLGMNENASQIISKNFRRSPFKWKMYEVWKINDKCDA